MSKESAQLVHGSYGENGVKFASGDDGQGWDQQFTMDDDHLGSAGKSPELLISHGFSHQELR